MKANPREFYRYISSQKKEDVQGIPPLKRGKEVVLPKQILRKASGLNGQFTDVFYKTEHSQVPLLDRSALFMDGIVVTK